MSQPSPLVNYATGKPRPADEETGWDLLGYGWPALLLCVGMIWGVIVQPGGGEGVADGGLFGLSREGLIDGRWWTLASHIFIDATIVPGIVLAFLLFLAGATTVATANPGWLGGWRTPTVFFVAAWAGALAQLSLAPTTSLAGPWAAASGLAAYYLLSGRLASVVASDETESSAEEQARGEAGSLALNWVNFWFLLLWLGPAMGWLPSILPGEGPVVFARDAVVVVGGAGAVYALVKLGGAWGRRIANLAVRAAALLMLVAMAYALGRWLLGHSSEVLSLPWPSYVAGLAVGVAAGLLERRGAPAL